MRYDNTYSLLWIGLLVPVVSGFGMIGGYEGDRCCLANGISAGVCRHYAQCPYLRTIPKKQWRTCSFDRDQPIVCCRAETIGFQSRFRHGNRVPFKSEQMCANFPKVSAIRNRILNGVTAQINEFPHMAALGYRSGDGDSMFRCGASLISDRFLLTAAHCVRRQKPSFARLGVVDIYYLDPNDPPVDVDITEVIIYPQYVDRSRRNDIALLRLSRTITEGFLQPACLYTNYTDPAPHVNLTIIGWGCTASHDLDKSPILRKGNVTVVDRAECHNSLSQTMAGGRMTNSLQDSQLCALGRNSQNETIVDACVGDSGGPLGLLIDRQHYIVGVISTGELCGSRSGGIYTRVSRYLDWIESIVWPD